MIIDRICSDIDSYYQRKIRHGHALTALCDNMTNWKLDTSSTVISVSYEHADCCVYGGAILFSVYSRFMQNYSEGYFEIVKEFFLPFGNLAKYRHIHNNYLNINQL